MSNRPIKSTSKLVSLEPYFNVQKNGNDQRYIVYLNEKIRIRTLIAGFINQSSSTVNIKIRDLKSPENPVDYNGTLDKSSIHKILTEFEDVLFHHGFHDLMFRNPSTEEYIVFDEHGLIFIYSNQDYEEVLSNLNVAYKPEEPLIYELDHWHYCIPNGEQKLLGFVNALGLSRV